MKELFLLDPHITYLNFGSFGACPKAVFTEYQRIQLELEQRPVQFMINTGMKELNSARVSLADYLACDANDVVFMTNPSYGINTIAKSIHLNKGDEILTTNLEYGAMDRTWNYYCNKAGAKYVQQEIKFPIKSKAHFLEQLWKGYTSKTKIIFISHITSSTQIRSMISITNDLERIGDIYYQMSKTIERKDDNRIYFLPEQREYLNNMLDKLDNAFAVMNVNLSSEYGHIILDDAEKAELEINQMRNQLRKSYLEQAEKGEYKFQQGIMYNDLFSYCEKVGDHIINVSEAVAGEV